MSIEDHIFETRLRLIGWLLFVAGVLLIAFLLLAIAGYAHAQPLGPGAGSKAARGTPILGMPWSDYENTNTDLQIIDACLGQVYLMSPLKDCRIHSFNACPTSCAVGQVVTGFDADCNPICSAGPSCACTTNADCEDLTTCTVDTCNAGLCAHTFTITSTCTPANPVIGFDPNLCAFTCAP